MHFKWVIMTILQPIQDSDTPEFLVIGHVTRDLHPDGTYSLGGTVTFAAVTAYRLGLATAIVTCADEQLLKELPARLPTIGIAAHVSPATTTFINQYHDGFRTQYLRARADSQQHEDVPKTCFRSKRAETSSRSRNAGNSGLPGALSGRTSSGS